MNLAIILKYTQIIIAALLIFFILIQAKGKGLASGIGSSFSFYRSKRGVEKLVFVLTVVFSILLVANSVLVVILH
jgi:preprotein translocase subunit SecG